MRLCFSKGASDYLTKPFAKSELIIKVERLFAQSEQSSKPYQGLLIDPVSLTVSCGTMTSVPLTTKELQIVTVIHQSQNYTVSRDDLVNRIWGKFKVSNNTLDVHIYNLRKKLTPLGLGINFTPPNLYFLSGEGMN